MAKQKIWQICQLCKGSKKIIETYRIVEGMEIPGGTLTKEVQCWQCEGEGKVLWGEVEII